MVQLVRDAGNPHDPGAVAAFVGSDHIGFVAKDSLGQGSPLHRVLARESKHGAAVTAWGSLTPVTLEGRSTYLGINLLCRVDEPGPALPFEVTLPPLGFGSLLGVETSQAALAAALGSEDEAFVQVTLEAAGSSPYRPDKPGPVLVVSLDGKPIGALSVGESKSRAPFVERLVDIGRPVLAMARIRRSSGAKGGLICSVSTPTA